MNEFRDEYRNDIKKFLETPGGKYLMTAILAKETALMMEATQASDPYKKAECVDRFHGVYFVRDIMTRWAQPKKSSATGAALTPVTKDLLTR